MKSYSIYSLVCFIDFFADKLICEIEIFILFNEDNSIELATVIKKKSECLHQ